MGLPAAQRNCSGICAISGHMIVPNAVIEQGDLENISVR
jgi:hypothetical protein